MMRRGFTVVELLITITIMGILLTLAVVNLTTTQMNGRDAQRKTDIDAIANNLEIYYKEGGDNPAVTVIGRYPSTAMLIGSEATVEAAVRQNIRDVDFKILAAPGVATSTSPNITASFIAATNSTQTTTGVAPQPTTSQFVYQPLQANGQLCTSDTAQECRKFNLYYRLEADNTVYTVTSKNQ